VIEPSDRDKKLAKQWLEGFAPEKRIKEVAQKLAVERAYITRASATLTVAKIRETLLQIEGMEMTAEIGFHLYNGLNEYINFIEADFAEFMATYQVGEN
jgi:hypothetical protein